jgi:hypothetical protein
MNVEVTVKAESNGTGEAQVLALAASQLFLNASVHLQQPAGLLGTVDPPNRFNGMREEFGA